MRVESGIVTGRKFAGNDNCTQVPTTYQPRSLSGRRPDPWVFLLSQLDDLEQKIERGRGPARSAITQYLALPRSQHVRRRRREPCRASEHDPDPNIGISNLFTARISRSRLAWSPQPIVDGCG